MKKTSIATSCLLVTLTLLLSLDISAQQNERAKKSKGSASLEGSLDQLGQVLKEGVVIEFNQWTGPRKTYVRLKQRGGCNISFQVSRVPSGSYVNKPNQPEDLGYAEWRVNLSDLEVAEVKIETPVKGDYRVIRFATLGGKESIKWNGFGVADAGWVSEGRIYISGKYVPRVAAALEQAISACRE